MTRQTARKASAKAGRSTASANEGEGNKTAARHFNQAQHRFVASGKVEAAARSARRAVDGPEGAQLRKAEAVGRSKARPAKSTTKS